MDEEEAQPEQEEAPQAAAQGATSLLGTEKALGDALKQKKIVTTLFGLGLSMSQTIIIGLVCVVAIGLAGYWLSQKGDPARDVASITNMSLLFPTGQNEAEMATCINSYIQKTASKSYLANHGSDFVSAGKSNNVNPALLVAIANAESTLGTAGVGASGGYNYFGMTVSGGSEYRKFSSPTDAITFQANYMRTEYLSKGLDSIEKIQQKYAPVGAANDPKVLNGEWAKNTMSSFNNIRAMCPSLVGLNESTLGGGESFISACQSGTNQSANCKAANLAILTAKDIKDHECPAGDGCKKSLQFTTKNGLSAYAKYSGGSFGTNYTSCARFVGYVVDNVFDKSFPGVTTEQLTYAKAHPDKYLITLNPGNSNLQPGDILLRGSCTAKGNGAYDCSTPEGGEVGHALMYVGENNVYPGNRFIRSSLNQWGPYPNNGTDNDMKILIRIKGTTTNSTPDSVRGNTHLPIDETTGQTVYPEVHGLSIRNNGKVSIPDPSNTILNGFSQGNWIGGSRWLRDKIGLTGYSDAIDLSPAGHRTIIPRKYPVYAPFDGKIIFKSTSDALHGDGGFIIMQSTQNPKTLALLAHLDPDTYGKPFKYGETSQAVKAGEKVGTLLSYVGKQGTHLHFEMWVNGSPVTGNSSAQVWTNMKKALGY